MTAVDSIGFLEERIFLILKDENNDENDLSEISASRVAFVVSDVSDAVRS